MNMNNTGLQRREQALRDNLRRRKAQNLAPLAAKKEIIQISGGAQLTGQITISGAKNAALPMMVASLLTEETLTLDNVPSLTDTTILAQLLTALGAQSRPDQNNNRHDNHQLQITAKTIATTSAPQSLVAQMRASFWIIGPLVARAGQALVPLPGGDAIGARPVEIYLEGLRALGAQITLNQDSVQVRAANKLHGNDFRLPFPSVGATHMMLMAASLAQGRTRLKNAAREPEIVALADLLNQMGARIQGAGSESITIDGQAKLNGTQARVPSDRIEAGTYAIAAAAAGGEITLINAPCDHLAALLAALGQAGITIKQMPSALTIARAPSAKILPVNITTAPHPGFPTDLQAQFMTLMTQAEGTSLITENIFENRFQHIKELQKLGADISSPKGKTAQIKGPTKLTGGEVSATDLRASVSLIIAALIAEGQSHIHNIHHLDRGFESLEAKLSQCGALIRRL